MALDPRLECLVEHQGPAFCTWQLIMQTTMGKVVQTPSPSGFQFQNNNNTSVKKKVSLPPVEDFISLETTTNNKEDNDILSLKRKKSISNSDSSSVSSSSSSSSSDDDEDQSFSGNVSPWKKIQSYPENALGLHMEIQDFYDYISPLPEEASMRKDVVQRMSDLIVSIWPQAKVEVFGSFRTDLYLPTSDIDLAVFGKWENLPLFTLEKALINKEIADPEDIKVLDKATVPIIKLKDKKSKIRVDISFNTETSVQSAEMIKSYIKEYKILPYLFLTLKHFLVQRDLNEVFTGGISSYCLMLLAISFLQRHPRIDVRKEKDVNLGVLLMEFFELYGRNFNYQRIGIKVKNGGSYFNKDELTKNMSDGMTNVPALLCIEDPVTLACDIGRSSYGILRVKEAFEYAYNVIDKALRNRNYFKINPNSTYLSRIISVPNDLKKYRKWVKKIYHPQVFQPLTPISATVPSSPNFHQVTTYQPATGRQALLPTPHSPYSPVMKLVAPFTYTTNANTYAPSPFYTNSNTRNNVRMNNFTTNNNNIVTTNQNVQIGFVYQNSFSKTSVEQKKSPVCQIYPPTNQSPVKAINGQQNFVNNTLPASTINARTFTNPAYSTSRRNNNTNNNNNNNIYYKQRDNYDRRPNSRNSSRNNSPRNSPKINPKEIHNHNSYNSSRDSYNTSRDYNYKKDFNYKDNRERKAHVTQKPLTDVDFPPISKSISNDKLVKQGKSAQTITASKTKSTKEVTGASTEVAVSSINELGPRNEIVIIENSNLKGSNSVNQTIIIESSDEEYSVSTKNEKNSTIIISDPSSSDES